jgi:hypothetical protein
MIEVSLDELEQACSLFHDKLKKFKDYIKYLETVPEEKLTAREKGLVVRFGKRRLTRKG